jgi:hypothetical protein
MQRTTALLLFSLPFLLASGACGSGAPASKAAEQAPAASGDALADMRAFIASKAIDTSKPGWKTSLPQPPKQGGTPTKALSIQSAKIVVE